MNDILIYEDNKWCYRYQLEDPIIYDQILERIGISKRVKIIPYGSEEYEEFFKVTIKQYSNN